MINDEAGLGVSVAELKLVIEPNPAQCAAREKLRSISSQTCCSPA